MPIVQGQLTREQRAAGRRAFIWFSRLNGVSMSCLTQGFLILYALRLGLPEFLIGFLASITFWTMPFVLLGKNLVRHTGAATAGAAGWAGRNAFGLLLAAVPLLARAPGTPLTIGLLYAAAFGFAAARSAGMVCINPILGEITEEGKRAEFPGRMFVNFYFCYLITMAGSVFILHRFEGIAAFQAIILFGSIGGFIATALVAGIHETNAPRKSAAVPLQTAFRNAIRNSRQRRLIYANAAGFAAMAIVLPLAVAVLKRGYHLGDGQAMAFTLTWMFGGVMASSLSGRMADHTGPRPLLILCAWGMVLVCLCWVVAPAAFHWAYMVPLFLFAGGVHMGIEVSLVQYFLMSVPETDRVPLGMFVHVASGVCAGLAGTVVGSGVVRALQSAGLSGLPLYRIYFGIAACVVAGLAGVLAKLEPVRDWRVRRVVGLLLSPRDMRELLTVSRLEKDNGPRSG